MSAANQEQQCAVNAGTLTEESSKRLEQLVSVPVGFKKVLHHVTLYYNVTPDMIKSLTQIFTSTIKVVATGYCYDNDAVVIAVTVNGSTNRLPNFGGKYHITHSHSDNVKPVYSNKVIETCPIILFDTPVVLSGHVELI